MTKELFFVGIIVVGFLVGSQNSDVSYIPTVSAATGATLVSDAAPAEEEVAVDESVVTTRRVCKNGRCTLERVVTAPSRVAKKIAENVATRSSSRRRGSFFRFRLFRRR